MNRRTTILLLFFLVIALALGAVGTYTLLPKRYQLGDRVVQTTAVWNQDEAFLFLALQVTGRSTNFIQEKFRLTHYGIPLLDLSLVADSPTHPANFCRLMVNSKYHCFAEITQFFPQRRAPLPLNCSLYSSLQEEWAITFSNRKPQAASSLVRRPKAIGVSMPDATLAELLQSFLKMRDQVCVDLGISFSKDDSLQAYISRVQSGANDMREALRQKNFALGLSEVYYRRFALLKTGTELVWLGDYPKIAEQRKQGYAAPDMKVT